jgi:putative selenium metabolism protein SsnA
MFLSRGRVGKIPRVDRPIALRRARLVADLAPGAVREDAGLAVSDGRVALLGSTAEIDAWVAKNPGTEVVDVDGRVLLPGLINAHTHLYSTLARGMPLLPGHAPPADFKAILEEIWWPLDRALDEESVYASALIGALEHARAGVTTIVDHHASETAIAGSLDLIERASLAVGVRVATCFELTDRDGPEAMRRGIEENVRFARRQHESLGGVPRTAAIFGLHASLTLSDATLALAREAGAGSFHIHVAESRFDVEDAQKKSGVRTVERLEKAGILGPRSIAAHCVHVDERERRILAASGTLVVTNPSSNRNNAVGRSDVSALLASGIPVAIGSDGMTPDVLGEVAQVFLGSKGDDPRRGRDEAIRVLANTKRIADVLFPGARLGTLVAGGPADLVVLDYVPWTPFETGNWIDHVIYGDLGARPRDVLCGGRWVLRDRRPAFDVEPLLHRARECARSLWNRRTPTRRTN